MFNKKKHSCVFCSNKNETSKSKVFFCRDCLKIRNYIRDNGIRTLLDKIESPTDKDIDDAMSSNICRCGTYSRIRKAIHKAVELKNQKA